MQDQHTNSSIESTILLNEYTLKCICLNWIRIVLNHATCVIQRTFKTFIREFIYSPRFRQYERERRGLKKGPKSKEEIQIQNVQSSAHPSKMPFPQRRLTYIPGMFSSEKDSVTATSGHPIDTQSSHAFTRANLNQDMRKICNEEKIEKDSTPTILRRSSDVVAGSSYGGAIRYKEKRRSASMLYPIESESLRKGSAMEEQSSITLKPKPPRSAPSRPSRHKWQGPSQGSTSPIIQDNSMTIENDTFDHKIETKIINYSPGKDIHVEHSNNGYNMQSIGGLINSTPSIADRRIQNIQKSNNDKINHHYYYPVNMNRFNKETNSLDRNVNNHKSSVENSSNSNNKNSNFYNIKHSNNNNNIDDAYLKFSNGNYDSYPSQISITNINSISNSNKSNKSRNMSFNSSYNRGVENIRNNNITSLETSELNLLPIVNKPMTSNDSFMINSSISDHNMNRYNDSINVDRSDQLSVHNSDNLWDQNIENDGNSNGNNQKSIDLWCDLTQKLEQEVTQIEIKIKFKNDEITALQYIRNQKKKAIERHLHQLQSGKIKSFIENNKIIGSELYGQLDQVRQILKSIVII